VFCYTQRLAGHYNYSPFAVIVRKSLGSEVFYFCVFEPSIWYKGFREKEMMHMDQRVPCPLCRHGNLPENRFCGHCGALLTGGGQLTPRPEAKPTMAIHSLPTKLGPAGKALAVGLAVLATEAGLVWLRRRGAYNDRPSPPPARTAKPADSEHTIGQSLEEVFVWLQEEGYFQGRGFGRWVVLDIRHRKRNTSAP